MASIPSDSSLHVVIFPFMSKGHTIPILHLSHLLLRRGASLTIFTTQANRPFISNSLSNTSGTTIISLPFPEDVAGVPAGVESTDKLPSISLFVQFATATKLMKPHFEQALEILPRVSFMITDGFLGWTLDSAAKFGIPRFVYYGLGTFAITMCHAMGSTRHLIEVESNDELFQMTDFPLVKLTINDFEPVFTGSEPKGPHYEFVMEQIIATSKSYGMIVNSFYELESQYLEYWNREAKPKLWCLGPFCLAEPSVIVNHDVKPWMQWLNQKLAEGKPILYVAFGSQADISNEQLEEIKVGLEKSEVSFLWAMGKNGWGLVDGFEERVRDRGLVVREWVDQREVLGHESVQGFLSHCGWNSVLESMCAKVPILAWPMMAEQHLNARFVVEGIKMGIRVETVNGSVRGFVKGKSLEKTVRELMEGEMGKEVRKKVKDMGEAAAKAVEEGAWFFVADV